MSSGDSTVTDELFLKYYKEWGGTEDHTANAPDLPIFLQRVPKDHEILPQKLREEARATFLEKKSQELLDNEELPSLWSVLERYHTPPSLGNEKFISYENFKKAAAEVPQKAKQYFTASLFASLIDDDVLFSRISILSFFNYVMKKSWLQHSRIGIFLFDVCGEGSLREADLESYILELIPSLCQVKIARKDGVGLILPSYFHLMSSKQNQTGLGVHGKEWVTSAFVQQIIYYSQLSNIEPSFQTFYVCTAVRKFFFFLDPMRSGRVRITDILASGFLDSMLELREVQASEIQLAANWFSHQSAMRVYGSYLQLDEDRNGLLTRSELSRFGNGTLTDVFLDRVFEECLTYEGEMDFKTYLDLVLAMENKHEPQAIMYLFRILDVGGQGKLTSLTLRYFYDGIASKLEDADNEPPSFENIQNEIFDMVRPANPDYITLNDLIECGKGETVINVLIDVQGFWAHENREVFASELPDEAEL